DDLLARRRRAGVPRPARGQDPRPRGHRSLTTWVPDAREAVTSQRKCESGPAWLQFRGGIADVPADVLSLGGLLDRRQRRGDPGARGLPAVGDLRVGLVAVLLAETLDALGPQLLVLGEDGAAVGRFERVTPVHPAVG